MLTDSDYPTPAHVPGLAAVYLRRLDAAGKRRLLRATTATAHAVDLSIPGHVEAEECAILAWWGAGWIRPLNFEPTIEQRSLYGSAQATRAHFGVSPKAYGWAPGPNAHEASAALM